MTSSLLAIKNLSGGYGDLLVIRSVSLSVLSGRAISITGRNGVGKSTLMRLISGSLPCSSGELKFLGSNIVQSGGHKRFSTGMSYAPQENIVFDDLTVEENLTIHYRDSSLDRYNALFEKFPRLNERLAQRAGTLSGGEKKLLSFSRVIAEPTQLVLLDEPTEGVQSENMYLMGQVINEEKSKGRGFLIVDQNLTFLEAFTDTIHLIDHGEQIFQTEGNKFRTEIESLIAI